MKNIYVEHFCKQRYDINKSVLKDYQNSSEPKINVVQSMFCSQKKKKFKNWFVTDNCVAIAILSNEGFDRNSEVLPISTSNQKCKTVKISFKSKSYYRNKYRKFKTFEQKEGNRQM